LGVWDNGGGGMEDRVIPPWVR